MSDTLNPVSEREQRTAAYQKLLGDRQRVLAGHFDRVLEGTGKFVWEIGCGHGHFLTAFAQKHPEELCIGIDIATERIDRALRKRNRARLPNLHFVQADAGLFLETLPIGVRFSTIFILFPDPWPKMRHWKHRLLQPRFLRKIAERSTPATRLYFRTDFQPYFAEVSASLGAETAWQEVDEPWPFEFETVFQSRAKSFSSLAARPIDPAIISSPQSILGAPN
jgi:tRNA (guanine-N7-)-methyltransferase